VCLLSYDSLLVKIDDKSCGLALSRYLLWIGFIALSPASPMGGSKGFRWPEAARCVGILPPLNKILAAFGKYG
jgi:hypothetical protein